MYLLQCCINDYKCELTNSSNLCDSCDSCSYMLMYCKEQDQPRTPLCVCDLKFAYNAVHGKKIAFFSPHFVIFVELNKLLIKNL